MGVMASLKYYCVRIEGENYLINEIIKKKIVRHKVGYVTTRYVRARNPKDAEMKAVELIRKDPTLARIVVNPRTDSPMLYAYEISEMTSFKGIKVPGAGFGFYAAMNSRKS